MLDGLTPDEQKLVKGMPDQVAIGFIKSHRAKTGSTEQGIAEGLAAMFDVFKKQP